METLEPYRILPESARSWRLMIFKRVVFPVPFAPRRPTTSPRLICTFKLRNKALSPKDLESPSIVSTSLPLRTSGSKVIRILLFKTTGLSTSSSLLSIFSRLSARLMDFSRLKERSFVITSS